MEDPFTNSERRQLERDIYYCGEGLGPDHTMAIEQNVKARKFHNDEDRDSDISALRDEIDDSPTVLKGLAANSGLESMVSASVEMATCLEECLQQQSKPTVSPKKSPYFAASGRTRTPSRKRKVNAEPLRDPIESLKRRKHDNGAADCNTVERGSVKLPRDLTSLPHLREATSSIDRSDSGTDCHEENKQNLNITGALTGSVEQTKEAADVRKAVRKDQKVRERVEHAVRRSSSQTIDPMNKSSKTVVKAKAYEDLPATIQHIAHGHRQTPNILEEGRGKARGLRQSQSPALIAPQAPVANTTKSPNRKAGTETQKAQRRKKAVKKKADQAEAAETVEAAKEELVGRKRECDEGANHPADGHEPKSATTTPTISGKKAWKHNREFSSEQRNQSEGFQSPMIQ